MSKSFTVLKRSLGKKFEQRKALGSGQEKDISSRVDNDLPLGLRIGSKISCSTAGYALYRGQMLMKKIDDPLYVLSFGTFEIANSTQKGFRFRLGAEHEVSATLQIILQEEDITECRLFTPYANDYPQGSEMDQARFWEDWLDEDGRIGISTFSLEDDGVEYGRAISPDGPDWINPIEAEEVVYQDSFDTKVERIHHMFMTYGRWLDEELEVAEFLMLSAEDHENEALVTLQIGIDIPSSGVSVHY